MVRDLPSIQQGQTSSLFSFRHSATTLVDMPDFRARKTRRDFRIALEMKHIVGKTEQSLFKDASCSVDSFFFLTEGRLNRGRLFFVIGSETCTFWMTSRSLTYLSYCSCPSCSIWKTCTVSTTACSAMFLLSSTRRSLLFSVKGFPYSSIVLARQSTSRLKAFWTCFVSSWWQKSVLFFFSVDISNSPITVAISGPDIIQRRRAAGFSVRPMAPPSPFTAALFCSWAWSIAIAENRRAVFLTTKFSFLN